jgi:hypothetical protein
MTAGHDDVLPDDRCRAGGVLEGDVLAGELEKQITDRFRKRSLRVIVVKISNALQACEMGAAIR